MSFFAKLNMTFFGEKAFIEKKLLRSDAFSVAIIFTRAAFMMYRFNIYDTGLWPK